MFFAASSLLASIVLASKVSATPSLALFLDGPESVGDIDDIAITTIVTNTGDESLKLFKDPRGAMSNFPAQTFFIANRNGVMPHFTGPKVKYSFNPDAPETSFTVLAPGEKVEIVHDLSGVYNYTKSGEGEYVLAAADRFYYLDANKEVQELVATESKTHNLVVNGLLSSRKTMYVPQTLVKREQYNGCSAQQQDDIQAGNNVTMEYLAGAIDYLTNLNATSDRFTTWFGPYSDKSRDFVLAHYAKINETNPQTYTYDCTCTEDYYAYVYPENFGYVYLCNAYWAAPTNGTDSKAGTVVHESSHFTKNAGTDDYVYGQSGCKSLAKSNPANAMMNADTHEYFAENTPFQS